MKYVIYTLAAICLLANFSLEMTASPAGQSLFAFKLELTAAQAAKDEFKELDDISILFEDENADYSEEDPSSLFKKLAPVSTPAQPSMPPTVPAETTVAPAPPQEILPPTEPGMAEPPALTVPDLATEPAVPTVEPVAAPVGEMAPNLPLAADQELNTIDTLTEFPLINPDQAGEENLEYDPYWNVPDAVKYIAPTQLMDAWVALHENKDKQGAIRILRDYTLANKQASNLPTASMYSADFVFDMAMFNDTSINSFVFQLLLAKVNMLNSMTEQNGELYDDKGVFWYAKGLEKVYQQKALHSRLSFVRGILSAAELGPEDFQQLNYAGIEIKYDPGMSKYVNSARLANKFMALPLEKQEIILNVALADKFFSQEVNKDDLGDLYSPTYKMLSILFNLGAYIKTERSFNYGANLIFTDEEYDLYRILADKFGFHTIDLIEISRLGEKKQP